MPNTDDQQTNNGQQAPAQGASWDDLFKGEDPIKVREALENSRKWEQRSKENFARLQELEPKAKQFDALEAASKSDLERAQEQATTLQQQASAAERRALIAEVALSKGLPATLARRLQGDTQADLEADADELLAQFGTTNQPTTRTPAPDLSQGSSANGGAQGSPAQQFASLIQQMPG